MSGMLKMLALDARQIVRDPLVAIFPFIPFLAAAAIGVAFPLAAVQLSARAGIDIGPFRPIAAAVVLLLAPSMLGTAVGFIMLEERDEGIGAYRAATPGGRAGYLAFRLGPPTVLAWIAGVAAVRLSGFSGEFAGLGGLPALAALAAAAVPAALGLPFYALCLAAVPANKIEGLAFAKAMGILDFAPLAVAAPASFRTAGMALPPFWVAEAVAGSTGFYVSLLAATILHAAAVAAAASFFVRRTD